MVLINLETITDRKDTSVDNGIPSIVITDGDNTDSKSYNVSNTGAPIQLKRLNTVDEGMENEGFEDDEDGNEEQHVIEKKPQINRFRGKQYGTIDVWWLYDDGGNTYR